MTQAPTPGPLSAQHEEAIAFNLCSLHGFDPAFVNTQRDFALAVIKEYERARPSLAPTAPVEASGSERDGPEVGEDAVAKILAPYLPTINSTPDLLSILYDADLMPEQTVTVRGAICVAAVCEAYKAALRPQPSGETRPTDEEIRSAIKATEYKYFGDYEFTKDQHDAVDILVRAAQALLSARPLALGSQQGERADRYYEALVQADLKIRSLPGTDQSDVEFIRAALSTTPARAEAQDEGAAGEPVACWIDGAPSGFRAQEWFIAKTTYGDRVVLRALPDEYAYDFKTADETYIKRDKIAAWMPFPDSQYAHPSPTPAADADRVRELEAAMKQACDLLAERTYGSHARSPGHNARLELEAALKSTAAKEGGV